MYVYSIYICIKSVRRRGVRAEVHVALAVRNCFGGLWIGTYDPLFGMRCFQSSHSGETAS